MVPLRIFLPCAFALTILLLSEGIKGTPDFLRSILFGITLFHEAVPFSMELGCSFGW